MQHKDAMERTFNTEARREELNKGVHSGGLRGLAPFLECGTALKASVDCDSAVPLSLKFVLLRASAPTFTSLNCVKKRYGRVVIYTCF
jgi:hypothetical protein